MKKCPYVGSCFDHNELLRGLHKHNKEQSRRKKRARSSSITNIQIDQTGPSKKTKRVQKQNITSVEDETRDDIHSTYGEVGKDILNTYDDTRDDIFSTYDERRDMINNSAKVSALSSNSHPVVKQSELMISNSNASNSVQAESTPVLDSNLSKLNNYCKQDENVTDNQTDHDSTSLSDSVINAQDEVTILIRPPDPSDDRFEKQLCENQSKKDLKDVGPILRIRKMNDRGLAVDLPKTTDVTQFLRLKRLGGEPVRIKLPEASVTYGVLNDVDPLIDEERLLEKLKPYGVLDVHRLAKPGCSSWVVKLTFWKNKMLKYVSLSGRRYIVSPFRTTRWDERKYSHKSCGEIDDSKKDSTKQKFSNRNHTQKNEANVTPPRYHRPERKTDSAAHHHRQPNGNFVYNHHLRNQRSYNRNHYVKHSNSKNNLTYQSKGKPPGIHGSEDTYGCTAHQDKQDVNYDANDQDQASKDTFIPKANVQEIVERIFNVLKDYGPSCPKPDSSV